MIDIAISWLEIWNEIVRIQRNITFQIDFSIAISHAKLFATTLDDNVNKTRREEFIDVIVYCLLLSLYEFVWKWSDRSFAVRFQNRLLQNQHFCWSRHVIFWQKCSVMLLLKLSFDQLSMFLMFRSESETIEIVVFASFLQMRLECRKFICSRKFRRVVQTFFMILTFLIDDYYYE